MVKRVIFFLGNCCSQNDYNRFGFDLIKKRGFKVEAWDFTPWINFNYYIKYKYLNKKKFKNYKTFNNTSDILNEMSKLSSSDIVIDLFQITNNEKFLYNIKKYNFKIGTVSLGIMPEIQNYNLFEKLFIKIYNFKNQPLKIIYKIFIFLFSNFKNKNYLYKKMDFIIVGGKKWKKHFITDYLKKTKIIKIHAFDYDKYLNKKIKKLNYKYSVFIDEDMPHHSDYEYLGIKPYASPSIYFSELNKFFSYYEKQTGIKIVIAACPRTDYKRKKNPFNGRKIISDNTSNLVKYAKHVFLHMSTSVNFAILHKKPVISLNSNNYNKLIAQNRIKKLSQEIGAKRINVSESFKDNFRNLKINKKKYDFYKESYIKEKNTPNKFIWEVFCDYLDNLKN